jgi:hypothetical protein
MVEKPTNFDSSVALIGIAAMLIAAIIYVFLDLSP